MKQVKTSQHWLKLLSAFWLIVAVQFGVAQPERISYQEVEYTEQVELSVAQQSYDFLTVEKTFSEPNDYADLAHLIHVSNVFDFRLIAEPPLPVLPDESRASSYFKIVSYQQFISSLSLVS